MENAMIYEDIAVRTGGDVYIGVVGPVRTGKSTFIKRFMETLVLPRIESEDLYARATDELPQSGSGRTIMTAEPKFVPEEAVKITVDGESELTLRLIDCVGYMVDGAFGAMEDGAERMVSTPWSPEPMPMREAAEIGTRKVIAEHSTIGVVITTDGSVTDIPREAYIPAEKRVINELRELGKPFVVLLNSKYPRSAEARQAAQEIATENNVSCVAVNCMELSEEDISAILSGVLGEFPISEYRVTLPDWIDAIDLNEPVKRGIFDAIREGLGASSLIREAKGAVGAISCDGGITATLTGIDMGTGSVSVAVQAPRALFYETLSGGSGFAISNDGDLMRLLGELGGLKQEYERVSEALREVRESGYGVVMPSDEELTLMEPEIVRRGGKYSVRLKAKAPAIHLISTEVETEVSPAVGGEKASGDVVNYLLQEFEGDTGRIWESNIFGKSLHDIAADSLGAKVRGMEPETREKIRGTLGRIINDGAGGLICIIL